MKKIILSTIIVLITISIGFSQQNTSGNAIQFNGESCVNFGNVDFGFTNEFTVMGWYRWDTVPSLANPWANFASINSIYSGDDGIFWIQHNSNNSKIEFALTTIKNGVKNRQFIYSSTTPVQGEWYHIAATFDGDYMHLFINGVEEANKHRNGDVNTLLSYYYFTIGGWAHSNNNHRVFYGLIDEVTVWNRALAGNEIDAMMNVNITGNENRLKGYWRFDEPSGDIIYDFSSSGFNGSLSNNGQCSPMDRTYSGAPIYGTLPVSLLYFQPLCGSDSNVVIEWATATEINNDYFVIHRSFDGINWEILAKIDGSGNTNSIHTYRYVDTKPMNKTIYYRLSQHDFDGKYEEFDMTSVFCKDNEKDLKVYPNPIRDEFTVSFNNISDMEGPVILQVFDQSGRLVASHTDEAFEGYNETRMNISQLPSGMYFIHVRFMDLYLHSGEILKN